MDREIEWLRQEKYDGQDTESFRADCHRLAAGEPLAYLIGHIPFLETTIDLASRPLIPRSETEYWTGQLIDHLAPSPPRAVLDLCAGSGCIGVAIAQAFRQATIDFVELEPAHHDTIQQNCQRNGIISERYQIHIGDLFTAVPPRQTYDLIVSNPPYIDPALDRTSESVRAYEPPEALYGGQHGIELITKILATASTYLTPQGQLWIEHEPEQGPLLTAATPASLRRQHTHTDQYGLARVSTWTVAL